MIIIWQDVVLFASILLYVAVGVMTKYTYYKVAAVTTLAETATYMEANPAARKIIDMKYGIVIAQVIMVGILLGTYASSRSHRFDSISSMYIFNSLTMSICWIFLWNFLNDVPIFLRVLQQVRAG